jgi:hypothetical protein
MIRFLCIYLACKKGYFKDVENYISSVNTKDISGEFPLFIGRF